MSKVKYNWEQVKQYLDVELKNGSANREKKHITLREFRDLVVSGQSLNQIAKTGVSKHISQFFSNLSQEKITLNKEDFIREYEEGRSLDEISKKYKVSRGDLTFLRQLYDIKRKGATYQKRKATEVPITQRQKEIIYGSLMGDAKKVSSNAVGFGQGRKQKFYLVWKYTEMDGIISKNSLKFTEYIDSRTGYKGENCRCYTHANSDLEEVIEQFYGGGEKEISMEILKNLTPLSIAVWFMDDGKTDWYHRTLKTKKRRTTECHIFCTDSFSLESCENIKKWFFDSYNIKCRIREQGLRKDGVTMKYRIVIEHESNDDFIAMIRPHTLPMFLYKIDYQEYLKWRK